MLEIPHQILEFAKYFSQNLVPQNRTAGWSELPSEKRGNGDLMDLIGTMVIFDKIASYNKVIKMDLTCGCGDRSDLEVRVKNDFKRVNIKTSSYAPYRQGLNLYVKKEEVDKGIDAYIQCFVHLDEDDQPPHVHIAGWIPTTSKTWNEAKNSLIKIPRTNGHYGVNIPVEKLGNFEKLVQMIDEKF